MPKRELDADSLLPLKADVFTILLVLAAGDAHGYAMMQAADDRVGRRGALQPGSLYRLLRSMVELGLVTELERREVPAAADRRRRTYRITSFGRSVAVAEAQRMSDLVGLSRELALLEEGEPA